MNRAMRKPFCRKKILWSSDDFFLIQFLFCLKVVKAIESGAQALKGINERNDLDKVSDVMDDLSQVYTQ